mgnify:CR=1 FL=1
MPDLRIPELSDEKLRSIRNIHLVACGTAMHAGMVGKTASSGWPVSLPRWTSPASSAIVTQSSTR